MRRQRAKCVGGNEVYEMRFVPKSPVEPFETQVHLRNVSAAIYYQMCQGVVY
jgi:hypothetical protein